MAKKNSGNVLAVIALIISCVLAFGMISQGRDKGEDSTTGTSTETSSSSSSESSEEGSSDTSEEPALVYPFDDAFAGAAVWTGPSVASNYEADIHDLYFEGIVDAEPLLNASYVVFNYANVVGAPGIKITSSCIDSSGWSMPEGAVYYTWKNGEGLSEEKTVLNEHITLEAGFVGAIVIPLDSFSGTDDPTVTGFYLSTNTYYNYGFEVWVGSIGVINADGEYTALHDPTGGAMCSVSLLFDPDMDGGSELTFKE